MQTTTISIRPPADVLETLSNIDEPVTATILDPWYNRGVGGQRDDYNSWLTEIVKAACEVSQHVFVWGFPEIVAHQVAAVPRGFSMVAWLTWYYKNCPSVIRGWRPAQNACLHLAAKAAKSYPEHFLNGAQLKRWQQGKMRFVPAPPTVIEAPLNIGFVGKSEQTGHPAQKPVSVFEPLVLMATQENDIVLDPMCGSGTTGEVCLRHKRRAILCDEAQEWLSLTEKRIRRVVNETEMVNGEASLWG